MEPTGVELYHRLINAWNERNAVGFAALFANDALCIGFDGSEMLGRVEILHQLATIFKDHSTARYVTLIQESGLLTRDTLIVRAHVGMVPPGKEHIDPSKNAIQVMVVNLSEGKPEIIIFQNTPAQFHGRPEDAKMFTGQLEEEYSVSHR
jgi:uncharacterized protein (TIGR02246 family)